MREPVWNERDLAGFANRLKDPDRIMDKVAESLAIKGRTAATVTAAGGMRRSPGTWRGTVARC